jgi:hypothetical protein
MGSIMSICSLSRTYALASKINYLALDYRVGTGFSAE